MRQKSSPFRAGNYGFTLIEILVSLLVLSLGLLGIAGLQAATSAYKMNTWTRSAASLLAGDFADRVRANPTAAGEAYWDSVPRASRYEFRATYAVQAGSALPSKSTVKNCMSDKCSPRERAAFDLLYWRHSVRDLLPQGAAWVAGNRADGFTVTLLWQDKDYVDATDQNPTAVTAPSCSALSSPTPAQVSSCCPAEVGAPAGVRCQNFFFLP